MSLTSFNPATLDPIGTVQRATVEGVREAVAHSREAQTRWRDVLPAERAKIMRAVADLIASEADRLASDLTAESGKTTFEALAAEVVPTAEAFRWLARHGGKTLAPQRLRHSSPLFLGKRSWIHHEPLGVVGIISPWNYPLAIPAIEVGFALMAGNGVVLKPSEHTPLIAERFKELTVQAGVPSGLFAVVHGEGDIGQAIVDAKPDRIQFTGSVETGHRVASAAGAHGIPVTLELGGKDAMIVRADANVDKAVAGAMFGAFFNAGQTCASVERLYVHRSIADAFIDGVTSSAKALRVGDPSKDDIDVGPMIHADQMAVVNAHVTAAERSGAARHCGGPVDTGLKGSFFAPAVMTGVPDDATLMCDETFGPVLPIRIIDSDEEAVALTNASPFGLTASVWTKDMTTARSLGRALDVGTVFVNDVLYSFASADAPWGGVKASGIGRTHSRAGLLDLTTSKHLSIETGLTPPVGYPFSPAASDMLRGTLAAIYQRGRRRVGGMFRAGNAARKVIGKRRP